MTPATIPATLRKLKKLVGWDEFGGLSRAGSGGGPSGRHRASRATSRAPASDRTRARRVKVETDGSVVVATGLTTQGQGHQTAFAQIVADDLGVPLDRVTVVTGDTRRFGYAVGTFASRAAGDERQRHRGRGAQGARQGAADRWRRPGSRSSATWRSPMASSRCAECRPSAIPLSTVAVLSNPLRYAFDDGVGTARPSSPLPADPDKPPVAEGEQPGLEATATTRRRVRPSPTACTPRSSRPTRTPPRSRSCATAWSTTAAH